MGLAVVVIIDALAIAVTRYREKLDYQSRCAQLAEARRAKTELREWHKKQKSPASSTHDPDGCGCTG